HHAEHVGGVADLPAEGPAGVGARPALQEGRCEGESAARRGWLPQRLRGHARPCILAALERCRAGAAGRPRRGRHQGEPARRRGGEEKQHNTKTGARQHQLALLPWGTDYFDPNSNAQAWCANPDDSDASKLKILAWRSHFVDPELTAMVDAASKELDNDKRMA